jgi:hypothetical protein
MHRQHVDDVGPVVASPVAVAEQVRDDRVAVGLVTDQNRAEVVSALKALASSRDVARDSESWSPSLL